MISLYKLMIPLAIFLYSFAYVNHKMDDPPSELETFADSLFLANVDSAYIAGASILVYQQGKMLLHKSYGYASLELSAPIPANASFEIGSVTKQFTAAAILQLVDQGKINLDDDLTKFIEFDTRGRKVTISQLLNHTSGIASYTEVPEFWDLSIEQHERDTLLRVMEKHDFLFEPGEALIYNNSGYYLLGLIIEKVSGKSYEEYLAENIWNPLGMHNTYYCSNSRVVKNKVYGYNYSKEALLQKPYLDHTWPYAAGSLCSTTDDLLIWMQSLHQKKILNDKLYQLITTPGSLNDGTALRYAMGLTKADNFGHLMIGHGGGINGFLSETRYFPNEDLYIICLVNTTGPHGAGYFADNITWKILDKIEPQSKPIDFDLKSVAGKYQGQARGRILTINVTPIENTLILSIENQNRPDTLKTY
ncbi:MAG: beta-lactamase family protein, partial [Saprospiraceae bacterium]|nr:beta-lactamase family protein [Saprospiraceae bacterium]